MTGRSIALVVFALLLLLSSWLIGGAAAWIYLIVYALGMVPGFPLGFTLFGRDHAAGWIAGAILGYALTALAMWVPIAAHVTSALTFVIAWGGVSALTWFACRRIPSPAVPPSPWTPAASTALLAVLVLTLAVATPPLAHVGRLDDQGNRYYRAYFTADFVWHTALTAEIGKFSMPPRNPYLARQPIHYYWTYYLLPATVSQVGPGAARDVQMCLKINALMTGLLLMSAVFLAAWTAAPRPIAAAAGATLALVASSAEGIFQTYRLWSRGAPLAELRNWNIDAVTAWPPFAGHRIDGLQRCLWYVPQHSMAYALGVIALVVAGTAGASSSLATIILAGIALGCSVAFNPLVGGIFSLAYGAAIVVMAWRQPALIARHGRFVHRVWHLPGTNYGNPVGRLQSVPDGSASRSGRLDVGARACTADARRDPASPQSRRDLLWMERPLDGTRPHRPAVACCASLPVARRPLSPRAAVVESAGGNGHAEHGASEPGTTRALSREPRVHGASRAPGRDHSCLPHGAVESRRRA